jgi:hypothetical protein
MAEKEISVIGQDGDYLLIADSAQNYRHHRRGRNGAGGTESFQRRIHQSLITDNGLAVVNGKISVSETLYREWFSEASAKAAEESVKLFYSCIPLFVKKQEVILRNPLFYSVLAPDGFCNHRTTLGELLLIWKHEPDFSLECECGGKAVIDHCGGFPSSGTCWVSGVCLRCGKEYHNIRPPKSLGSYSSISGKYRPIEPFSRNPVSVKDLVAALGGRRQAWKYDREKR